MTDFLREAKRPDPPPIRQQALPNTTVRAAVAQAASVDTDGGRALAALITIAFFFLLRVGEYTPGNEDKQTVPLRKADLTLWRGTSRIPHDAPDSALHAATAVTICLENSKNGKKGCTLHHESSGDPGFDPVQAAAARLSVLRGLPGTTPISVWIDAQGRRRHITSRQVRATLRLAAQHTGILGMGYSLHRIGTHSLRSGGAMHLRLLGYDEITIRKLGRWTGDTYLVYIQSQIANLTSGIAAGMARPLSFHVVA